MGNKKSVQKNCNDLQTMLEKRSTELGRAQKEIYRLEQESKKLRKSLHKAQNKAASAFQARNDFFANISHEFRNPLTSVLGFSSLLLKETDGGLNDDQKTLVENITNSGKQLLNFVNDLLELSRFETGNIELLYANFSLNKLLKQAIQDLNKSNTERNIHFVLKTDQENFIEADQKRIMQAIRIVLDHSLRYSLKNSTVVVFINKSTVETRDGNKTHNISINVDVTNPNLDNDSFRTFYNNISASDPKFLNLYNNAGAGFALCKKITKLHKGKFEIQSNEQGGCRFVLTIPEKQEKLTSSKVFNPDSSLLSWDSFQQHINRLISLCKRENKNFGILRLDFSHIDDQSELITLTELIKDCHREHEILASCGNWRDCIYLMLWDANKEVAQNAISRISRIAIEKRKEVKISSLIYPDDGKSADEMLGKFHHAGMTPN